MKPVLASLSLLLVACSAPQPSGSVAAPGASAAAPVAAAPVAAAPGSVAMGKRVPGDVALPLQVFRVFGNPLSGNTTTDDVNRYAASACVQGITTITGRSSSIRAIGPCLSSPAAKPSAWM